MKKYQYKPHGVCSRQINIEIDDNGKIADIGFVGGCNGNLKGIGALTKGLKPEEVIERLEGINCNMKGTSCPDQLAQALKSILKEN